jgi:hypothetical protein
MHIHMLLSRPASQSRLINRMRSTVRRQTSFHKNEILIWAFKVVMEVAKTAKGPCLQRLKFFAQQGKQRQP